MSNRDESSSLSERTAGPGPRSDDVEAQRLLVALRDGTDADQSAARLGLAQIFERRGLLDEAVACYLANLEHGDRDPRTCERLAGVLRRQRGEPVAPTAAPVPDAEHTVPAEMGRERIRVSVVNLNVGEWAILLIVALVCRVILDLGTGYSVVVAGFMMGVIALITIVFVERRCEEQAECEGSRTRASRAGQPHVATLEAVAQTLILIPLAVEVLMFLVRRVIG